MMRTRVIKKGFFTAIAFWIIFTLALIRISATLQLTNAVPVLDKLTPNGPVCQLGDDSVEEFSNTYVSPSQSLTKKYLAGKQGNNLSPNPKLDSFESDSSPLGYPNNRSVYPSEKDILSENGENFLRAEQKITGDNNQTGWQSEFTPVKDKAYYFSFDHRSDVTAEVTIEFLDRAQNYSAKWLYEISPSQNWSKVEGHFDNYHGEYLSSRVIVSTTDIGKLDIKNPEIYELVDDKLPSSVVSLSFDDGWQSVYVAGKPIFDEYGVKTTQFIVPSLAKERVKGYMNFNEVVELNNSGHEIASHSLAHCDLASLEPEKLEKDLSQSNQIFDDIGFSSQFGLAYPYGRLNQTSQNIAKNYFSYQRTSVQDYNDGYFDLRAIKSMSVESTTSLEQFESWVDYAVKHRLWLVLTYHKVGEDGQFSTSESDLRSQIEIIHASGAKIETIKQSLLFFD